MTCDLRKNYSEKYKGEFFVSMKEILTTDQHFIVRRYKRGFIRDSKSTVSDNKTSFYKSSFLTYH